MIKYKTDLISHPYFIFLEIWELYQQSKKPRQKTQVLNIYINQVRKRFIWDGDISWIRQALENIKWISII